ncbi:CUB and LDLa domain isoform X2 [Bombus fervidus]|uniref:CUB and LDLa domain isoform X2 n=1 Tax=Bombus fervidus TaxID=203811 RepID=UPI003AB1ECE5
MLALKAIVGISLWWSTVVTGEGNIVRNEDICGAQNGRRLYLELGEKGILYARNVSLIKNEPRQEGSQVYTSNSSHAQCNLELVTCPSCVIIVTFESIALSHHCGDGSITLDSPCRCDYVWISEPPYEDVSGTPFCGLYAPITYRSSTRTLSITLLYSQSHKHAFTLEYTAERNRLHLRGTELATATGQAAKGLNSTGGGILTSPFFPARYPRDLGLEYVVTCPSEAPSCRIRLLFSDFQLATVSIMEFYDWNGQRLDVSSGARFRPPVIMSSGPSLLIRFYANGGTGLGYKAFYSFVIGHPLDKSVQPITDCGGYVENLGGTITMLDMVGEGVKTYDCVWLIRPPKNFLHMKTHMYLKVITFADMAGNTELVVKQGPTSALLPLEILRHPASQVQPPRHREHVAPVTSGFHVSLRGTFGSSSHLAIAYAAFSYMDCFAGSDFLCRNHRCIPSQLNCDGFDHCGDNSDEPATCFQDWELEPQDRKWHANKANYYFPKIDRYPDLKTATLVFVASSLGLIVLISALIILLYRMGARARQQRELQSRLQTISELLDGARIDEITVSDDPPVYEAPPGYDEVVKLGFDSEIIARRKKRAFGRETRGRSSPSQSCSLDVERSSSVCSLAEMAGSSCGSGRVTSSSNQGIPKNRTTTRRLPESPPPPYVTPPGSISRHFNICGLAPVDSNTRERHDEEEEQAEGKEEESRRRNWLRRAGEPFSSSLSGIGDLAGPATPGDLEAQGSLVSINVEFLGAYSPTCSASNSIRTASVSCDSQRRTSRVASTDTESLDRGDRGGDAEETVEGEKRSGATIESDMEEQIEEPCEEPGGQPTVEDAVVDNVSEDNVNSDDGFVSGCSCEGACGCATVRRSSSFRERTIGRLWAVRRVTADQDAERSVAEETNRRRCQRESGKKSGQEQKRNEKKENAVDTRRGRKMEEGEDDDMEEEEREEREEGKEGGSGYQSRSSTIVKLLGARMGKWQNGSAGSTVASTASSTPCGTFGRSMRKLPVCSRDGYLGRTSTIGSISSYEKLCNGEFEEPRMNLHASDPVSIGSSYRARRGYRRYSSCDLQSLYDGMRILDGFLARRGLAVAHTRKQSVTVMLFGTPEHGAIRRRPIGEEGTIREIGRVSRLSLDGFSN